MKNLTPSSLSFKAGNNPRRREDLPGYVALGLVMKEVRSHQRRLLAETPGRQITVNAGGRR